MKRKTIIATLLLGCSTVPALLLSPSASKASRNWHVAGYAGLVTHAQQRGLQVVLCGGPSVSERQLGTDICAACPQPPLNLIGQTNLKQLMALIQQVQLVLAPDTGPTHMATAAGVPVIGLYAHHNPQRTGPYRSRELVVSVYQPLMEAQSGRPLAELPWRSRLKDDQAMTRIQPQAVLETFDRFVQAHFPAQ